MRVTLRLADGLTSAEGQLKVATLGRAPFIVGRSPDADWTLTEPTNQISGVHFELRVQGSDLLLTDLSSGGTALGSARNRLHREQPTRLEEDTRLFLPVGTVQITIERDGVVPRRLPEADDGRDFFEIGQVREELGLHTSEQRARPADPDRLLHDPHLGSPGAQRLDDDLFERGGPTPARGAGGGGGGAKLLDPDVLLGGGGGGAVEPPRPAVQRGLDDVPSSDAYAPPRPRDPLEADPLATPQPDPGPGISRLPDAEDLLGGGTERPMGGAAPAHELPTGQKTGTSWLDDDEDTLFQEPARREPEPEPAPEPEPVPDVVTAPVAAPEPPQPQPETAQVAPQPAPAPEAQPESQVGAAPGAAEADIALKALFAELGVPLDGDPQANAELCAEIGRTYVAMADAMRRMLETRAEVKRALGIVATEVELGANPLKTARDSTAAVDGLIRPLSSGFLSGEAAVEDTLESMQAHQYALVSGIKAALNKTLAEFDPETLEQRLTKRGMSTWLASRRKAALWDAFTQNYDRFSEQAHENFRMLVGRELDSLYHRHRHSPGPGLGHRDQD